MTDLDRSIAFYEQAIGPKTHRWEGGSAAVANAGFNATGRRVRELPIMLDKLL